MKSSQSYLSNALGKLALASSSLMAESEKKEGLRVFFNRTYLKAYIPLFEKYGQPFYDERFDSNFFAKSLPFLDEFFPAELGPGYQDPTARFIVFDSLNQFLRCIHHIILLDSSKLPEFTSVVKSIIMYSEKYHGIELIQEELNRFMILLKPQVTENDELFALMMRAMSFSPPEKKDFPLFDAVFAEEDMSRFQSLQDIGAFFREKSKNEYYGGNDDEGEDISFLISKNFLSLSVKKEILNQLCCRRFHKDSDDNISKIIEAISTELGISKKDLFLDPDFLEEEYRGKQTLFDEFLSNCDYNGDIFLKRIISLINNGFPATELMGQPRFKKLYHQFYSHQKEEHNLLSLLFDEEFVVINNSKILDVIEMFQAAIKSFSNDVVLPNIYFLLPQTMDWKMRLFLSTKIHDEAKMPCLESFEKLQGWLSSLPGNTESFEDLLMGVQPFFGQLIDIMGIDSALLWLEKYAIGETAAPLKKVLNDMRLMPKSMVALLAVFFERHKAIILGETFFFKIWAHCLITVSSLSEFIVNATAEFLPEDRMVFLDNYLKFIENFVVINERAGIKEAIHFREPNAFFTRFAVPIGQIIQIMGLDAFAFYQKYLAGTVISLERMLEKMSPISDELMPVIKELFKHYKTDILGGKNCFKIWENIVIVAMLMVDFKNRMPGESTQCLLMGADDAPLPDTLVLLHQVLINNFLKLAFYSLALSEEEIERIDVDALMQKISPQDLPKLILAQQKMQRDRYYPIFVQLLKAYLLDNTIEHIIHGNTAALALKGSPSVQLIEHNATIHQTLIEAKVNPDFARYPEKFSFVYEKNAGSNQVMSILSALWGDIRTVKSQILEWKTTLLSKEDETLLKSLEKLLKTIGEIEKNYSKHDKLSVLLNEANRNLLRKIRSVLNHLEKQYSATMPVTFAEHAQHYRDRYDALDALPKDLQERKQPLEDSKHFKVAHWDKNKIESLFLGSPVQCCLAPDGHQFQALIQRLMDDAMFFHVVTEGDSDVPVALSWLYFAQDKERPEDVYVMANFLEIAPKYGSDEDAKKVIINALLYYTQQFSRDMGTKGLLVNHLSYGWVRGLQIFDRFDQKAMTPQKVGGCLNLGDTHADISQLYYLPSLDARRFHVYDLTKIPEAERLRFLRPEVSMPAPARAISSAIMLGNQSSSFFAKSVVTEAPVPSHSFKNIAKKK